MPHSDIRDFPAHERWKALILYGYNQATYKIALGKTLLALSQEAETHVPWDRLAQVFFDQYHARLAEDPMPQQTNPARQTVMERIVGRYQRGQLSYGDAAEAVGRDAFQDVIPRFHNLGTDDRLQGTFYRFEPGRHLILTDALLRIVEVSASELEAELGARWSLLEGAFAMKHTHYDLSNDLRQIYLERGYDRRNLTPNVPFLQGYQGNTCFYCGEPIAPAEVHVDHVLPRQVVQHDEIWNLVLAHAFCNEQKSDQLVGPAFIEKLIARNENIMGSNHPWKQKIIQALGTTPTRRRRVLEQHYDRVKRILGSYYWGGSKHHNPESDPFYGKLITVMNNT